MKVYSKLSLRTKFCLGGKQLDNGKELRKWWMARAKFTITIFAILRHNYQKVFTNIFFSFIQNWYTFPKYALFNKWGVSRPFLSPFHHDTPKGTGQKGTKRDKIFIKTLKMPILMAKLVGKGTKRDIKNQKF